jgi:hypothetical protein
MESTMRQTTFKGQTITREEMLKAMERFDQEQRPTFPAKRWKTYAVEHNGNLYPPKETLRLAVDKKDIGTGGQPVNSRFEGLGFKIITLQDQEGLSAEVIEEAEAIETSISLERDLEDYLEVNLSLLEPDLKLYQGEGFNGRQCDTKVVGIIDILATDKNGDFVIIELKAGEADDRVCGQIQRYMGWVEDVLAGSHKVRGIIVANEFSDGLRYAQRIVPNIRLTKYSVSFKFAEI